MELVILVGALAALGAAALAFGHDSRDPFARPGAQASSVSQLTNFPV